MHRRNWNRNGEMFAGPSSCRSVPRSPCITPLNVLPTLPRSTRPNLQFSHKVYNKDTFWEDAIVEGTSGGNSVVEGKVNEDDEDKGWKYWERVYLNPTLSAALRENIKTDVSMTKMLANEQFIMAQLTFEDVPYLGRHAQRTVRLLLENKCGKNISLFDVTVGGKKWRIRFRSCEDALNVQRHFHGYRFRGHTLQVDYEPMKHEKNRNEKEAEKKASEEVRRPSRSFVIPDEEREIAADKTWGNFEKKCLEQFKRELTSVLERVPLGGVAALRDTVFKDSPLLIRDALTVWPIGLLRLITGKARSLVDVWEPRSPFIIEDEREMADYARALLLRFGPQRGAIDLPWRLFASTLSRCHGWPRDAKLLMRFVAKQSVRFTLLQGTLFVTANRLHIELIAKKVRGIPR